MFPQLLADYNACYTLSRKNVELLYDLDGSEGGIALNLFQLLLKDQASSRQASSSRYGTVSSQIDCSNIPYWCF